MHVAHKRIRAVGRSCGPGQRARSGLPRGGAAAAVVLAAGALTIGCGGSSSTQSSGAGAASSHRTVNTEQVEKGIETSLSTSSIKVSKATCPSDVSVERGAAFTCSVTLSSGGTGKVTVTQQGANQYTYEFAPGSVQIPGATADAAIEKSLAAQGAPNARVTCPQNIIVKVNTTVTCDVSGGQGAVGGTVTFTFSEANGTVDPASVKTS
jgi:hypothetical protein